MADTGPKRISPLRLLVLVLALILLVFAVIGALVTLFAPNDRAAPGSGKDAPRVHQVERDSLRREAHPPGS